VSGFYNVILIPFRINDIKVQTLNPFSKERFVEMIEKYKINLIFMPSSHLFSFLQSPLSDTADLSSVRLIYMNGCMASLQLFETFHKKFASIFLINGYGMTEISVANPAPGKVYANKATTGTVVPNLTVKIVDDDGRKLGVGEIGEVCAKRPLPFLVSL
jgi:acyl-coenzyme A synthetase/AMP-(fatty) acid ligase